MSRPGPGQPTLLEFGISGRRPRHVRTRDGNEEWRYYPHDLDPGNRANIDEVIRQLHLSRQARIKIGIVGQLEEPYGNYEPAHVTLFHPAWVPRRELIRTLEAARAKEQAALAALQPGMPLPRPALEEGLALGDPARPWTQHQWAEVYTVYLEEEVRPE